MRRFLRMGGTVAILLLTLTSVESAVAGSRSDVARAHDERLEISFVNEAGEVQSGPNFDVAAAFPGMPPQRSVVAIRNAGTVEAVYDVAVVVRGAGAGRSLADVLTTTIRLVGDDRVAYAGSLAGMSLSPASPLAAGETAAYDVVVAWPDGGDRDNAYQGVGFSFDIIARARPAR